MKLIIDAIYKYTDIETIETIDKVSDVKVTLDGLYFSTPSTIPNYRRSHFTPLDEIISVSLLDEWDNLLYKFENLHRGNPHE